MDAVRAAESALGQARTLLDAVDSAASDINRAIAGLPAAITDINNGISQAALLCSTIRPRLLGRTDRRARDAASAASTDATTNGKADPLGTFTRLTKADADLDQLLASVHAQREAADRLARALEQAIDTTQSRIKAVSDFIDTRRGSIGGSTHPAQRSQPATGGRAGQARQQPE